MAHLLASHPLLVLFLVAALGFPLGRVKVRGISLGVSAVLFVGLAFGAVDERFKLPEIVYLLGLALFVYAIGLSSGPAFVASLKRDGWKYNLLAAAMLAVASLLAVGAASVLHLGGPITAGLLAGALTNTPALAGALETLKRAGGGPELEAILAEPVVGYSVAYPVGVIGVVLAIALAQRLWKVDYAAEARDLRQLGGGNEPILNRTVRVSRRGAGASLGDLLRARGWQLTFGRIKRGDHFVLADADERLRVGDLVTVVGTAEELDRATTALGEESDERIDLDRREYDQRRIFVSNPDVAGRRLGDLELDRRFDATITRVRRGDADILPRADTVLELGDRVRVVARTERMQEVSAWFGDSYKAVSEVDVFTFGLGLALGLLLGAVPVPLPGGVRISLGFAGGPLVVALVLGTLGRTGPIVWTLPYAANMTLRQIGLVFFLAGVGTRAGRSFVTTLGSSGGLALFAAGAVVTCATALLALWIGHKLVRVPMTLLIGMVAGIQTQPAVLGYALEQTGNDLPSVGYASVYPLAMILKILLVQVVLIFLL